MSDSLLNIDQNTLNGYGILTVNLTNNNIDEKRSQYFDLNTDYYIYYTKILKSDSSAINEVFSDCWFISNYDLSNYSFIKVISGPYYNKPLAFEQLLNYPSGTNTQYTSLEKVFVLINENAKNVHINNLLYNVNNISLFTFYAPFLRHT